MRKYLKYFLTALPITILIIFVVLEIMSRSAAIIFNNVMAEQKMLIGTITAEKIEANIFGEVTFKNFLWTDIRGEKIIELPEGSFKVKILDVLTKNFQSTTIQSLTLNGANISLDLDENMNLDFTGHSPDFKKVSHEIKEDKNSWENKISRANKTEEELKQIGEHRRKIQQEKIEKGWKNFHVEGRKIDLNLELNNCRIEIFQQNRHYIFGGVNFKTKVNTDDEMILNVRSGTFGGMMIGRGMEIHGRVDFKPEIPTCNLSILLQEVDPSSLGFGLNIHDTMTLTANFTGSVSRPVGTGVLEMKELHIPGLDFKNLEGNIYYEDSMLNFSDVVAEVYGGELSAHGDYNIDTRRYNIYGNGKNLKTYFALPKSHLHCDVDLEIEIKSKGSAKETFTSGNFYSGRGRYSVLKIKSISGKFKTEYNSINFYDVKIDMGNYKFSTDALSIENKKLKLSPIEMTDENGNLLQTYTRD